MKPVQRLLHRGGDPTLRQGWAVDQHDRQAKRTGGDQLCLRPGAAGVLGNDPGDTMAAQKGCIPRHVEGATGDLDHGARQGKRPPRRIDEAQKVVMLRLVRESRQMLPPDGEEDPLRRAGKLRGGGGKIGNMGPAVTLPGLPGRAFERQKRRSRCGAGGDGIAAHLRGKRVGRVDHPADPLRPQPVRQPLRPAEAADADRQGLGARALHPPGIGEDAGQPRFCHGDGEARGLGRAAKDEGLPQGGRAHG